MIFRDLTGQSYTWAQFADMFSANMHRYWGGRLNRDVMSDAIQQVYLDLLENWVNYPSAVAEDGTYKLERALMHGRGRFYRFYVKELTGRSAAHGDFETLVAGLYLEGPGVEKGELLEFLNSQPPDVVDDWFAHLEGTEQEQADREGVSQQAVSKRRKTRRRQMKAAWDAYQS